MEIKTKIYLKKKFQEYYSKAFVYAPKRIKEREFGIGTLEKKIAFRHKSFASESELRDYLKINAPFYISYSSAYYKFPENPVNEKIWLGSDLIFDLDIDMDLIEQEKLNKVKDEALKLIDFLKEDFGISGSEIQTNFSGNRGFHVKVFNEVIEKLGKDERIEIINYITANGLNEKFFFDNAPISGIVYSRGNPKYVKGMEIGPKKTDKGWGGRLFDCAIELLNEKKIKIENKEEVIQRISERGEWEDIVPYIKNIKEKAKNKAVHLTSDTDKMVSTDISHLIRLENTLHGGTGFNSGIVRDLDKFDLSHEIVFSEEKTKIIVPEKVKLNLKEKYELKNEVEVPEYVAVYLCLKGRAEIVF